MTSGSVLVRRRAARPLTLESVTAIVLAAALGMNIDLPYGLTIGGALAIALTPVWLRSLTRSRWAMALALVVVAAVVSGFVLTMALSDSHGQITSELVARSVRLGLLVVGVGALLWAHRVVGLAATCVAFGAGAVIALPLDLIGGEVTWRFTLSIPLTLLALALVSTSARLWPSLLVLGALAGIGLVNDSRSNSAFLLITALLLVWQRLFSRRSTRGRGWGVIVMLVLSAYAVVLLVQAAILEGYFGEVTQARTEEQLQRGGNVLLGGRPEIAASAALISRYPLGMGSGIRPTYDDVVAAKTGMLSIGYDPNNGYVERFMFGNGVEVHSVIGDLWIWFGIPGLVLAVFTLILVILGLQRAYGNTLLTALFAYMSLRIIWDMGFSPVTTTTRAWMLVLTLAIAYATYRVKENKPALRNLEPT